MASSLQTGITAAAINRYLRGPGKLYKNFTDLNSPGTLLGETKGGSVFDWGLEFHDVEPDGAMGLVKGHRFISRIVPTLEVNLLEHTVTNWLGALPGADSDDQTPTGMVEYLGTGLDCQSGVTLAGGSDVDFDSLEIWYGADGSPTTKATLGTDYTVNESTGVVTTIASTSGGSIGDTDEVTAKYVYDSTSSGDAYTIITPGQIETGDYWSNIALVCELSNQTYSNPYAVFVLKNVLSEPSTVEIPGGAMEETIIKAKFTAFFDPSVGLDPTHAPVEFWLGAA